MRDCVGKELFIGDKIIAADGKNAELLLGHVIRLTNQKIKISYVRGSNQQEEPQQATKYPWQVFKYE